MASTGPSHGSALPRQVVPIPVAPDQDRHAQFSVATPANAHTGRGILPLSSSWERKTVREISPGDREHPWQSRNLCRPEIVNGSRGPLQRRQFDLNQPVGLIPVNILYTS